ncbi:hypothetical protein PUN28_010300 [Cardiocondyla obscurior]|uniref:Uncharacterized protein n=1 Tax=Cardiocondyla obscurior TaxID=286306 RepID=A0AAW2FPJ5_9HYME
MISFTKIPMRPLLLSTPPTIEKPSFFGAPFSKIIVNRSIDKLDPRRIAGASGPRFLTTWNFFIPVIFRRLTVVSSATQETLVFVDDVSLKEADGSTLLFFEIHASGSLRVRVKALPHVSPISSPKVGFGSLAICNSTVPTQLRKALRASVIDIPRILRPHTRTISSPIRNCFDLAASPLTSILAIT